ncbi:MAG: hypothetical protein A3F72_15170 [Bacteroidetes bacterium RIFCSPLOWO2_12_FULL_35_15]|nr:MAG: hypothetical protein A3F72_15170 [Bacteroidetes bacterium RIFCSPLOWO2_12_FULL_35_15]
MKRILLLIVFSVSLSYTIVAQKISSTDVPTVVAETFKSKFSIAEKVNWNLDYDKYKAEFKVSKSQYSATFDKDGKWLKTETYLKPSDLPKLAKENLTKEFGELSDYKIEDPEKVETNDGIKYEMEVRKGELTYRIVVSEKGEIISKEEIDPN